MKMQQHKESITRPAKENDVPLVDNFFLLRLLLTSTLPNPLSPKYNTYKPGRYAAHFGARFLRGTHGIDKSGDWFKRCFVPDKEYALSKTGVKFIFQMFNWPPPPPDEAIDELVNEAVDADAPLFQINTEPRRNNGKGKNVREDVADKDDLSAQQLETLELTKHSVREVFGEREELELIKRAMREITGEEFELIKHAMREVAGEELELIKRAMREVNGELEARMTEQIMQEVHKAFDAQRNVWEQ